MNEFKGTKGPWAAVRSDPAEGVDCWWICAGDGNREKEFATVYGGVGAHEANAQLIASAPELYDALKALLPYFEGEHAYDHPCSVQARSALLKASPEQSDG